MIKLRRANTVKCWLFREFLKASEDLDDLCKEHGWATATFMVPVIGGENEFVAEYEYPDFATFQAENAAQMSDPEYLKIFRSTADLVYPRSARTELCQDAPSRRVSSSRQVASNRQVLSSRQVASSQSRRSLADATKVDDHRVKVPTYA